MVVLLFCAMAETKAEADLSKSPHIIRRGAPSVKTGRRRTSLAPLPESGLGLWK
jgi:hypothetical protein